MPATIRSVLSILMLLSPGCGSRAAAPRAGDGEVVQRRVEAARGRPLLLSFWATWCRPCIEEIPDLAALHADRDLGVRVVAVSLDAFSAGEDAAPGKVREFLAATPTPYEQIVYLGSQADIVRRFQLPGNIPYAILYDAQGREIERFVGRVSRDAVAAALRTAAAS